MPISIGLQLKIATPPMPHRLQCEVNRERLVDKMLEYCGDVESGGRNVTRYQWQYLRRLFLKLQGCHAKFPEYEIIWDALLPLMLKYARDDAELAPLLDGAKLLTKQGGK